MTQPKCGAPLEPSGHCRNPAMVGHSRCYQHRGKWTAYGMAREQKKAAQARLRALRKKS
ncbi:hypothetical protein [Streptomyces sp. NBC_01408]|uniref:hypothetical protein n=1 Tax=Streptomyces sp. NBC_01408 TaxID=2903855 RepID=UPI00224E546F|nr:hypothetical protein [Streptomyces sp. NBC_01408]MCX4694021.1 hypothetical protein [Streptomyces sp. NBC_01408]